MKSTSMRTTHRSAFTLVEILIVVVIMAILAATIIPQFTDSTADAKKSTAVFNLGQLRSTIELYKTQHGGVKPSATLIELTQTTNAAGTAGTGAAFVYGPYLREIPPNPMTNSQAVKVITNNPAVAGDVTSGGAGWLYHVGSGNVWLDHSTLYDE
jgi:prepilin-type N-terminal cleavage/methylation domain-containing protein